MAGEDGSGDVSARGVFITFEGGEGCGKSTQIGLLEAVLAGLGLGVVVLREPGGTDLGEVVRAILLDRAHDAMSARAELLLYEASRAQLIVERIRPALAIGEVVVCDRFTDSTLAYQGYGRGLLLEEIAQLNRMTTGGLTPDLTVMLDIAPVIGLARATHGGTDRLEAEDVGFHERVRRGFLELAAADPARCVVIDASGTAEEVHAHVIDALRRIPVIEVLLERSRR